MLAYAESTVKRYATWMGEKKLHQINLCKDNQSSKLQQLLEVSLLELPKNLRVVHIASVPHSHK
jgi:hypothetical protein